MGDETRLLAVVEYGERYLTLQLPEWLSFELLNEVDREGSDVRLGAYVFSDDAMSRLRQEKVKRDKQRGDHE